MSELGIDQSRLDADESINVEALSTDAEVKTEETSEIEASGSRETEAKDASDIGNESVTEGEENKEALTEAPVQTAKEIQEIETLRQEFKVKEDKFHEETLRFEQRQKEFDDKIKSHDEIDHLLINLETDDPELYGLFKNYAADHYRKLNDPQVMHLKNEMSAIKAELNQFKSNATAEVTLTQMNADIEKLQNTLGKEAEAAGLKIDAGKVKETWAKNPGLSLEQAAFVIYGPQLIKASASKAKVQAVENKIGSRPTVKTAGSIQSSKQSITPDFSKMTTREVVEYEARQFRRA